ncbi:membrane protein YdbS with pleckstrin-like domain [Flavobacterium sp. CG_23.5]|uniref:PH domain-containing protein n=1 Tax=Flavobacterium sp. CG_23.5 TaxID=2760708 RepID=UPI001AE521D4|nr:PH domain-containing protein [Flavobacterium sp. CG_23.5]MBP2282326.1 membrane protein YdbS with pleckstrin-like domain [Flavobacterium sp. CG_23.5]
MENFTNETIDTSELPKFEEVQFTALHPNYWKVTMINCIILILFLSFGVTSGLIFIEELSGFELPFIILTIVIIGLILLFSRIAFRKKGFAFRNHDVLFRHGIIASNTIVIPYNRIQHVALHEGLVSRYFGLAKIEIFTAGGSSSDIEIPGIEKEQAEKIKQLLMGKIQKQLQ